MIGRRFLTLVFLQYFARVFLSMSVSSLRSALLRCTEKAQHDAVRGGSQSERIAAQFHCSACSNIVLSNIIAPLKLRGSSIHRIKISLDVLPVAHFYHKKTRWIMKLVWKFAGVLLLLDEMYSQQQMHVTGGKLNEKMNTSPAYRCWRVRRVGSENVTVHF